MFFNMSVAVFTPPPNIFMILNQLQNGEKESLFYLGELYGQLNCLLLELSDGLKFAWRVGRISSVFQKKSINFDLVWFIL